MASQVGSGVQGLTVEERLWRLTTVEGECWEWQGFRNPFGYGRITIDGRKWLTHRAAYEWLVGPIPTGLTIDHLCRNRACWRPDHLEPVDIRTNILRGSYGNGNGSKTHCSRGHLLEGENLYQHSGRRHCRACRRIHMQAFKERTHRSPRQTTRLGVS